MLDGGAHRGTLGAEGRRRLGQHLRHDGLRVEAGERGFAGEHLIGHRAEGVHIAAGTDVAFAHRLLGRHVGRGAERHACLCHPAAAGLLDGEGDAEVGDQGGAVLQQDVLGLDVAVHDPLPMGVVERGGHFLRQAECIVDRQLLLAGEAIAQRLARDVGHDVIQQAGNRQS